jgi:hypothetical protein
MWRNNFDLHDLKGITGISQVEDRDAAKHPTVYRALTFEKNSQNINNRCKTYTSVFFTFLAFILL